MKKGKLINWAFSIYVHENIDRWRKSDIRSLKADYVYKKFANAHGVIDRKGRSINAGLIFAALSRLYQVNQ